MAFEFLEERNRIEYKSQVLDDFEEALARSKTGSGTHCSTGSESYHIRRTTSTGERPGLEQVGSSCNEKTA